jgi:hypothetical protein
MRVRAKRSVQDAREASRLADLFGLRPPFTILTFRLVAAPRPFDVGQF